MGEITLHHIFRASKTIKNLVRRTPLIESNRLGQLYLKPELLQPTGSFKVRGAANKICSLSPDEQLRGVCTFSTGNHGLAVSYIAGCFGIPAYICISDHVPERKKNAIERCGGNILLCGEGQDQAEAYCKELEKKQGLCLIAPFDDPAIIAGQGTIGLEILEDLPEVGTLLVPLSGGGLLSGIAFTAKAINPAVQVIGISMARGAAMYESLKVGHPLEVREEPTLADSLLGGIGMDNRYTFQLVRQYMDDIILLDEEEIAEGIRYLMEEHSLIAEGAGAVGVAAIISGKIHPQGKVVSIVSGGNIGLDWVEQVLGSTNAHPNHLDA